MKKQPISFDMNSLLAMLGSVMETYQANGWMSGIGECDKEEMIVIKDFAMSMSDFKECIQTWEKMKHFFKGDRIPPSPMNIRYDAEINETYEMPNPAQGG